MKYLAIAVLVAMLGLPLTAQWRIEGREEARAAARLEATHAQDGGDARGKPLAHAGPPRDGGLAA